jgi:hypothetical protein
MTLAKEIKKALETNIEYGAGVYRNGPVTVTWFPDEGRGIVDVTNPEGLDYRQLKRQSVEIINQLPEGVWEFNPDTPQKGRIYKNIADEFKGVFAVNPDQPNNALIFVKPKEGASRRSINTLARKAGLTSYYDPVLKAEFAPEYQGGGWVNRTARRASEQRGGSRELSQLAKEQKRRAQKAGLDVPLTQRDKKLVQQLTNLTTDPNSPYYRYQVDHVYDMALYDEAFNPRLLGNTPEALQLLTQRENIQKFQEGKALSNQLAQMELMNPSRSMNPEAVQRAIGAHRNLYSQAVKAVQAVPKPVLGLIPVVGMGFDAAEAAERTQRAAQQPTLANKVQASIAGVGAATTAAPNPVAQAVNFGAGVLNMGIDAARYVKQQLTSEEIMRAIGQIKPPTLFP